jgi:hypothetical protein
LPVIGIKRRGKGAFGSVTLPLQAIRQEKSQQLLAFVDG